MENNATSAHLTQNVPGPKPEYAYEAPPPYPGSPQQSQPNQGYLQPGGFPQAYQPPFIPVAQPAQTHVVFIARNGCVCPVCHTGMMVEENHACEIACIVILAILCFPIGLLYLLCLPSEKTYRCSQCAYSCGHK